MHQIIIYTSEHSRLNLCYQITFCRHNTKGFGSLSQQQLNQSNLVEDPTTGNDTAPSQKEKSLTSANSMSQHTADYIRLMMQEGMELPMGEDRVAPLITEV